MPTDSPSRPNLLYIMTDQQSASAMSCAGNPELHTPHMDRLAAEGVRFENAYCAFPLCLPTRTSMFTGLAPHQVGVHSNGSSDLRPAQVERSLGRLLREAGYHCAYGGKTHLARLADGTSADWGWERIAPQVDPEIPVATGDYLDRYANGEFGDRPFFLTASFDNPHNICEWARHQSLPWGDVPRVPVEDCPSLPPNFAIPPYEPDAPRWEMGQDLKVYPTAGWTPDDWRHYRHAYFRLVEKVDAEIGRILHHLDRTGLAERTIVVFISDHGDGHGAHQLNQKTFLYEEQTNVPLIVRMPGGVGAGRVEGTLANAALDLLPTVCDLLGVEAPDLSSEGSPGMSLAPLLGAEPGRVDREAVFVETCFPPPINFGTHGRMVRTERFKYVAFDKGRYREQLFDLANDPGEMVNLAVDSRWRDELNRHRRLLAAWAERTEDRLLFDVRWGLPIQR